MWLLVITAVSLTNPDDKPGQVTLQFDTQAQCQAALSTMKSWTIFPVAYKIEAQCIPRPS